MRCILMICLLVICTQLFAQTESTTAANDAKSDLIYQSVFQKVGPSINGFTIVKGKNVYNFIDASGALLNQQWVDSIRRFYNGMAAVKMQNKWGFINAKGVQVIPCIYDRVVDFLEDVASGFIGDQDFVLYKDGSVLTPLPVSQRTQPTLALPKNYIIPINFNNRTLGIACPTNLDFEAGSFLNWQTNIGETSAKRIGSDSVNMITLPVSTWKNGANTINRHMLQDRNSTPNQKDFYGDFSVHPPTGGRYSLKLGDGENDYNSSCSCPNALAEAIRYVIDVPPAPAGLDFSVTFSYAVVFENPLAAVNLHTEYEQPRFLVKFYDPTPGGDTIKCANFTFVASSPLPGFDTSTKKRVSDAIIKYKDWSSVYVNLGKYAGKQLYLEFTTGDCTKTGHFGYAYVDVQECGVTASSIYKCSNTSATLTGPPGFKDYKWFDNTFSNVVGTSQTINLSNPVVGSNYWVVVTPYPNTGCPTCDCTDTLGVKVQLNLPVADAGPDRILCQGKSEQIGIGSVPNYSYQWTPATGLSSSNIASPIATPSSDIKYFVTATDMLTGCSAKDSIDIKVSPKPVPAFVLINAKQCLVGNSFSFQNNSTTTVGNLSYLWSFGDGTNSTATNPTHSYSVPGTYTVKLFATGNNGCTDSIAHQLSVDASPNTTITLNASDQCLKANKILLSSNASGISTYHWQIGNLFSSVQQNDQYTFTQPGNYTVKFIATSVNGCKDSATRNIIIHPDPIAMFSPVTAAQCLNGNNFNFNNTSSIGSGSLNYTWNFGDNAGTSTAISPAYTYQNAGTYMVQLLCTSAAGCKDSIRKSIIIYPKPDVQYAMNNGQQCFPNNNFTFTNNSTVSSGNNTYLWSFGDGNYSSQPSTSHTYSTVGTYNVWLLATSNNGCKDSIAKPVQVFAIPQVAMSSSLLKICAGDSASIQVTAIPGSGTIASYEWYRDGVVLPAFTGSLHPVSQAGRYEVVVRNSNGCSNRSAAVVVVVNPLPVGTILPPASYNLCEGYSVELNAVGGFSYQWYLDGVVIMGATGSKYFANKEGTYTVKLINQYGCSALANNDLNISLVKKPVANFSFTGYCVNQPVTFNNLSVVNNTGAVVWNWRFGDGTSSAALSPQHTYVQTGNYRVWLKVTSVICSQLADSIRRDISIEAPLSGIRYPTVNAVLNKAQQLDARPIGIRYAWLPGVGLNSPNIVNPIFWHNKDQEYLIRIQTLSGCSLTDTVLVRIFKDGGIYVPRAWSPNRDGHNDRLAPILVGMMQLKVFRIFNRWGQLMFETPIAKHGWDGMFNNNPQPTDTYTWTVEALDPDGHLIRKSGNSVLIR